MVRFQATQLPPGDSQMSRDKPGTRILPPLPYVAAGVLGWWLDRNVIAIGLPLGPAQWPLALLAIAAGTGLMVWAARTLWRRKTTVNPFAAASNLCREGPFRFSRNPIYLGDWLVLAGASAALDSAWPLLFSPLVWLVVRHGVIRPEEAHLEAMFGDAYRAYCADVRRWL
jgi:protein-S-isoprenylcysteine O-methyltransferase Ste14